MNYETNKPAPGDLEVVRKFLNTWKISNETRQEEDQFAAGNDVYLFAKENHLSASENKDEGFEEIKQFRSEIRKNLRRKTETIHLNRLLKKYSVYPVLVDDVNKKTPKVIFESSGSICGQLLSIIVQSIADGNWEKLKECPDCKWVFYDHTRNSSKVWCGMYAIHEKGRACGTISKVKRFRERKKG